ncbi:unnamed protein product, partial [Staurois parvus]
MVRCLLGHMTGPRRLRAIHKVHAQWAPGCHPAVIEAAAGRRKDNSAEVEAGTCQIQ